MKTIYETKTQGNRFISLQLTSDYTVIRLLFTPLSQVTVKLIHFTYTQLNTEWILGFNFSRYYDSLIGHGFDWLLIDWLVY